MATEKEMQLAKNVYETLCTGMDQKGWKYKRFDDKLAASIGFRSDDLPVEIVIMVRAENQVISLFSKMPFEVNEDHRVDLAVAVAVANYGIINGSFDYDISDGEIRYRIVNSYRGCTVGPELIGYLVNVATSTADEYNDKFLAVATGVMDIQKFIEWDKNR